MKNKEISDIEAIKLIGTGNKNVFEVIFSRYFIHVKRKYESRLNYNNELAKDLAMEFFGKLYQNLDKYNPEVGGFNAWMTRGSENHFNDYIRKTKSEKCINTISLDASVSIGSDEDTTFAQNVEEDFTQVKSYNPEQLCIKNEQKAILMKHIDQLDDKFKVLIKLCYFDGLSYEEICDTTHMTMNNVKGQLSRAKFLLRRSMQSNMI